jgi:hypothetical protein
MNRGQPGVNRNRRTLKGCVTKMSMPLSMLPTRLYRRTSKLKAQFDSG